MSRGLELLVSVGGVHDVDRSEDSALFAEIELDWRLGSRGFLGLGAGAWDLGEDAEAAVLLSFGRDLRLHVGRQPARLVLEGRFFPDTSGEDLVIVGGLRFLRP